MIFTNLIKPNKIVVVGGSNNLSKPGGRIVKNLLNGSFSGDIFIINPKAEIIQGIKTFKSPKTLPQPVDIAIIAIPAKFCLQVVKELINKNIKNFIVLSAGFSEESNEGRMWELEMTNAINQVNGCLIGPNCIGVMNTNYQAVFTSPVPKLYQENSCDLISGSGATAVFIMDVGINEGLRFSSVYSVGNAAQIGVEDVLAFLDKNFDSSKSAKVKLLYFESIKNPKQLLYHASSLIKKGCKIVAIKAGKSSAGVRAASSHTGALSTPYKAVECLFEKAGIIACDSRMELVNIAKLLLNKELNGNNIAIISNAGGPAVMLTDVLTQNGFNVPLFKDEVKLDLLKNLFPGASANNPIDLMATGTAEQLDNCIDFCENKLENIDAVCIIFGNPGLSPISDALMVLDNRIKIGKKPIYVVLPSILNSKKEIQNFIGEGNVVFYDEVLLGRAMNKIINIFPKTYPKTSFFISKEKVLEVIKNNSTGEFLKQADVYKLLNIAGIEVVKHIMVNTTEEAMKAAKNIGFPIVMKAIGILHKTEKSAVSLNVQENSHVVDEFNRLIQIKGVNSVEISKMIEGLEFFIGVKKENNFGHILMCGMGGIYIEVLKDIQSKLLPISGLTEAKEMIQNLRMYPIIKGYRGKPGFSVNKAAEIICRVSALVEAIPMIEELDINPLIGKENKIITVDARIKI